MLADSNVQLEMNRVDNNSTNELRARMRSYGIDALPSAVLVAPDGRSKLVAFPVSGDDRSAASKDTLDSLVRSELRASLLEKLADLHSAVLIVESKNAEDNERVRAMVDRVIEKIAATLPDLPKPIDVAPQVWVLSQEDAQREEILLWSLGVDVEDNDKPQIALIFGRGRKLGPTIDINDNAERSLLRSLAIVGLDCECELDRSWMQAPMFPHVWTEANEMQAARSLGFDPGHPLVKVEMSRILSRGPSSQGPRSEISPDTLLPGLQIIELNFDEEEPSPSVEVPQPKPESAALVTATPPESDGSDPQSPDSNDSIQLSKAQSPEEFSSIRREESPSDDSSLFGTVAAILVGVGVLGIIGGALVVFYGRRP
jgi:hypothetical protein